MTRKHFEALAAAMNSTLFHAQRPETYDQWLSDAQALADVCARLNPNFDRARFLKACGAEEAK